MMLGVNLLSVKSFGEAEYWFAGIKVVVIVAFIIAGAAFLLGLWTGSPGAPEPGVGNLFSHGGFVPEGVPAIFVGVVTVIFSMTGAELVTIAAAESSHPADAIRRTTQTVVVRILAFFVISTALLVAILPWDEYTAGVSPFITALDAMGLPYTADILNFIVLVAVLSCLNSGLYTASRMIFTQGRNGDAPACMTRVNGRGVPVGGILFSVVVGFICVAAVYVWPETIFLYLVNSSGAVVLFVYVFIGLSQIRLRPRLEAELAGSGGLTFRMFGWPWSPGLVTAIIVVILGAMAFNPDMRRVAGAVAGRAGGGRRHRRVPAEDGHPRPLRGSAGDAAGGRRRRRLLPGPRLREPGAPVPRRRPGRQLRRLRPPPRAAHAGARFARVIA
ncbi:hypothetical protein [Corynebacterium sp. 335C]